MEMKGEERLRSAPCLEHLDDLKNQLGEGSRRHRSGLSHLLMVERLLEDASSHVSDAGDADDLGALVTSSDDLRDGGHADCISADGTSHADLSRSLVGGTAIGLVNTLDDLDATGGGSLADEVKALGRVGAHVREARAEAVVVGANERVHAKHVDVVGHEHEVTGLEGGVDTTGSIGNDELLHAEVVHGADANDDGLGIVALVQVPAALLDDDELAADVASNKLTDMTGNGGLGEVGDLAVRDDDGIHAVLGEITKAASKNKPGNGLLIAKLSADISSSSSRTIVASSHYISNRRGGRQRANTLSYTQTTTIT